MRPAALHGLDSSTTTGKKHQVHGRCHPVVLALRTPWWSRSSWEREHFLTDGSCNGHLRCSDVVTGGAVPKNIDGTCIAIPNLPLMQRMKLRELASRTLRQQERCTLQPTLSQRRTAQERVALSRSPRVWYVDPASPRLCNIAFSKNTACATSVPTSV